MEGKTRVESIIFDNEEEKGEVTVKEEKRSYYLTTEENKPNKTRVESSI